MPGGETYGLLLAVEDGADRPLGAIAEFRAYQEGLKK